MALRPRLMWRVLNSGRNAEPLLAADVTKDPRYVPGPSTMRSLIAAFGSRRALNRRVAAGRRRARRADAERPGAPGARRFVLF